MQSASNFGGNGSPFGPLQVIAPFTDTPIMRNSSHIQELYQNLPQLQKAIYLPVTYKSFETQNTLQIPYSEQQQSVLSLPYKQQASNYKLHHIKHRFEQESEKDHNILYKRNGWGDPGQHHHGNSSALSALALLGFMFFLQLIQNSLQNNRQMLAAAALNTTTVGLVAGRENGPNKYLYNWDKRSIAKNEKFTSFNDNRGRHRREIQSDQMKRHDREKFEPVSLEANSQPSNSTKHQKSRKPISTKFTHINNPIDILQTSSVHCCQLIACKIGESIYDSLDTTTGFMVRMLGTTMIPRIPRKTWAGRLFRAIDKGWKKQSCDNLYRNCGILYNLFHNTTSATQQSRRKPKHSDKRSNTH